MRATLVTTILAASLCACAAVPSLTFVDDSDASADATTESGTDDAGDLDGSFDAFGIDAAGLCEAGIIPPGATACCDDIPCTGICNVSSCNKCKLCSVTDMCCGKTGTATCVPYGSLCPP
jgi:hypothetical protein